MTFNKTVFTIDKKEHCIPLPPPKKKRKKDFTQYRHGLPQVRYISCSKAMFANSWINMYMWLTLFNPASEFMITALDLLTCIC